MTLMGTGLSSDISPMRLRDTFTIICLHQLHIAYTSRNIFSAFYRLSYCGLVTPYGVRVLVNIDSGNDLLPDNTKPLPESKLTKQQ